MKRILNLQKPGFLFSLLFTIFSFFCATVHLDNTSLWQPEGVKGKDETRRTRRTSHDRHMLPLQFLKRNLVISWDATGTLLCVEPLWEKNRCIALPSFLESLHVLVVQVVLVVPLHVLVIMLLLKLLDEKRLLVWISWTLLLSIAPELPKCLLVQGILQENNVQVLFKEDFFRRKNKFNRKLMLLAYRW